MDHKLDKFKHNYQSILVTNMLEKTYHDYAGLNLLWETRDGILKHSKIHSDIDLAYFDNQLTKEPSWPISLEGQIVAIVDEIAQRTHDTDDALRSNRIDMEDLVKIELVKKALEENNMPEQRVVHDFKENRTLVISSLIVFLLKYYIKETIVHSKENISKLNIRSYDDVKNSKEIIISWNAEFARLDSDFNDGFLKPNYYNHYEIKKNGFSR